MKKWIFSAASAGALAVNLAGARWQQRVAATSFRFSFLYWIFQLILPVIVALLIGYTIGLFLKLASKTAAWIGFLFFLGMQLLVSIPMLGIWLFKMTFLPVFLEMYLMQLARFPVLALLSGLCLATCLRKPEPKFTV